MRKNFGAKPFLYPQPVMILGTYDENGKANAMNAAWGGIVGANEIIVDLSAHKTTDNIIKNKAFTVGVADLEHLGSLTLCLPLDFHNPLHYSPLRLIFLSNFYFFSVLFCTLVV